jgi:signal transduction histidine kinase
MIRNLERQAVLAACLIGFLLFFIAASAVYSLRNIRLRGRALLKIHESQLRADSANEMKSRFVADMSHELRTPLNGILGFSDLISRSPDIEKSRNYGRLINTSAKHLHLLVNTMLDLAKIEAGKMDVVRTSCDVREVCDSVAGIHRYTAEAKDLILSVEYSAGIPVFIHTDRIKLMQILNNILHNSIKFTEKGCIFFHVSRSENSWIFKISDTGIGMNSKELDRLFDRFSRSSLKAQAVARQVGSGLGMALCKELTELLNGTIHVSSTVGVGTLVEIRIYDLNEEEIQNEAPH